MEYEILFDENPTSLSRRVEDYLQQGWVLQGGVSASCTMYNNEREGYSKIMYLYAQAIFRGIQL